jgi:EmrB/QacA subfamily drug resistance transporter
MVELGDAPGSERIAPASRRAAPAGRGGERPVPRRGAVLAVLCVSILVVNLDNTILNVALPTLVRKLGATSSELQWIVDAYAMVFAGLLLVGGSLADRYGRKKLFLAGLTIFAGGSIGAAFAGSVAELIAWRGVMGSGAALTMPSTLSIINDVFREPAERSRAIGLWAGTSGIGIAIGPIAGGLLLSRFWWGSVFFVNVPIVVVGALAALAIVPDSKNPAAARPDPLGGLLSMLGLGCVLWAIIEAPTSGWTAPRVVEVGLAGLIVLASFVAWELYCDHPMLNLAFFRRRRFSAATSSLALGVFGLFGALFVQTQFLQFDLRLSAIQAGVHILPIAAVVAVAAPLSSLIVRRFGSKLVAAAGLFAIGGGLAQIAAVSSSTTTYPEVVGGMLLIGLGAGLLMPTATDAVVGSVPRGEAGVGAATNGVSIQVGGALGVAVIGSVLSTRYQHRLGAALQGQPLPLGALHSALGSLGGALEVAAKLPALDASALAQVARSAFMSGAGLALAAGAVLSCAGALIALAALPARPDAAPSTTPESERPAATRSAAVDG